MSKSSQAPGFECRLLRASAKLVGQMGDCRKSDIKPRSNARHTTQCERHENKRMQRYLGIETRRRLTCIEAKFVACAARLLVSELLLLITAACMALLVM